MHHVFGIAPVVIAFKSRGAESIGFIFSFYTTTWFITLATLVFVGSFLAGNKKAFKLLTHMWGVEKSAKKSMTVLIWLVVVSLEILGSNIQTP